MTFKSKEEHDRYCRAKQNLLDKRWKTGDWPQPNSEKIDIRRAIKENKSLLEFDKKTMR